MNETGRVDFVAFFLGCNAGTNRVRDLNVGSITAQQSADIGLFEAEQAVSKFSIGGNSDSIAAHAKRLADGRDESDPTHSVVEFKFGLLIDL